MPAVETIITYLNPQLKSETEIAITELKSWLSEKSYETIVKEGYGEDICDCCINKLELAAKYVEYMECYGFSYFYYTFIFDVVISGYEYPYNCIDENMLKTLVEKSKIITTQKC